MARGEKRKGNNESKNNEMARYIRKYYKLSKKEHKKDKTHKKQPNEELKYTKQIIK